jgi:hypothetical protein
MNTELTSHLLLSVFRNIRFSIAVKCALKLQMVHLLGAMDGPDLQTTKLEINFD